MHLPQQTRILRAAVATCGAVALTVGLAACGSSDSGDAGSSGSGSDGLTLATTGPVPATWNPQEPGAPTTTFSDPVYDTLIHYGKDGQLQPWLATSWNFTTPTTLELKLRDDVTFSDGAKFDASAVQANLQAALDNKANAGDQVFLANITGMTVVDPTTIDLALAQPNPALPYDFSQASGYMASPTALASGALKQGPIGSGPYVLDTGASRPGVSYVFKANPDYWAADQDVFPYDKLTLSVIADPTAAKNAATTGQVDALTVQPGTDISGFKQVTSVAGDQSGMTGVWLDTTGTALQPLSDQRVRQALNYAIDREKLGKAVYQDTAIAVPAVPVTDKDPAWSDELGAKYPYDTGKAKQLLADAGYADGFELTLISLPQADQFAQAIAGQLQEVGVKVNIESHAADLVQAVQSGTRPAGLALQRLTGDPGQDLQNAFDPNAFFNVHHGNDPQLTALLQQAAQTSDENARNELYQQAALRGSDDSWYIGTLVLQTITAYDADVVSVEPPDRGALHLYDFHLPS